MGTEDKDTKPGTGAETEKETGKEAAKLSGTEAIELALARILEQETSEEAMELKRLALRKAAMECDTARARIPAPLNITEIGGYYNLLENDPEMKRMMLASILGLPY